MANAALQLVRKSSSSSGTFIAPLRNTLTPTQLSRAIRILSPTLPKGWLNYSGLKASHVRAVSGATELLHQMRKNSKGIGQRAGNSTKVSARKEIHVGPRTRRTLSAAGRKAIATAQKKRWRKYLTPEQRQEQKRATARKWYQKNQERLRVKARERYHASNEKKAA